MHCIVIQLDLVQLGLLGFVSIPVSVIVLFTLSCCMIAQMGAVIAVLLHSAVSALLRLWWIRRSSTTASLVFASAVLILCISPLCGWTIRPLMSGLTTCEAGCLCVSCGSVA